MNKKFSVISLLLLLAFSSISKAGFNGLTMHSRANCANNESISWDATHTWHLATNSMHAMHGKKYHEFGSGVERTKRSAAVHWGEGTGGWAVYGTHYILDDKSNKIIRAILSQSVDCSAYDGWWDWNP